MNLKSNNIVFHHTGIVTGDISASKNFFVNLGYQPSQLFKDVSQGSFVIVLNKKNSPIIELITPTQDKSPSNGWLKRIRAGSYHVCFEIKDIGLNYGIDYFKMQNFTVISKPTISPAFNRSHVVFLWAKTAGLIELLGSI